MSECSLTQSWGEWVIDVINIYDTFSNLTRRIFVGVKSVKECAILVMIQIQRNHHDTIQRNLNCVHIFWIWSNSETQSEWYLQQFKDTTATFPIARPNHAASNELVLASGVGLISASNGQGVCPRTMPRCCRHCGHTHQLTYCPLATYQCFIFIDLGNGLAPSRHQAIT